METKSAHDCSPSSCSCHEKDRQQSGRHGRSRHYRRKERSSARAEDQTEPTLTAGDKEAEHTGQRTSFYK